MINFANPQLLYLLLIVPVIAGLYFLGRSARRRKLKKFGKLNIIQNLMPDASRYMPGVKIIIELLAVVFIIIAIARPYATNSDFGAKEEETSAGVEVMICFDLSNSMLASSTDDPKGISRLQRAKFILEKLLDKLGNDKVGLIVFAGDAYTQLPITSDFISAKMFINNLNTDAVPTQGTAIGAALNMAINSFTPDSDFQKAIILITDAENFEDNAMEEAKRAADAGIQVDVIGLGTVKGNPIPVNATGTEFMTDYEGNQVKTALNEQLADEIAKTGNGIYVWGGDRNVVDQLSDQLDRLSKTEFKRSAAPSAASELFPVAIVIALCLLLIDMLLPYAKIEWLTKFTFFSKSHKK